MFIERDLTVDRHLILTHRLRARRVELGLTEDPTQWSPDQPSPLLRPSSATPVTGNWILGPDVPTRATAHRS